MENSKCIYIHNPAHNGDVLFSSKIVDIIVKSNPDQYFKLYPSCSSILFEHLVSDKVEIVDYPKKWVYDHNEDVQELNDIQKYILEQENTLYSVHEGNLFINMWQLMIYGNNDCFNISNRVEFVKQMFETIKQATEFSLHFHANHYKELVPEIPQLDISGLIQKINAIIVSRQLVYKKKVMFFNFIGQSGSEVFHSSFNDDFIKTLLKDRPNDLIVIPDHCEIKHPRLISLMDDCNVQKEHSGRSIVIYANLCNLCDDVYFKNNGGSLFQLNKVNVANRRTNYIYLNVLTNGREVFYRAFKDMYGLNIVN